MSRSSPGGSHEAGVERPPPLAAQTGGARSPRRLRWLLPALLLVAWFAINGVAAPFQGKLAEVQGNDDAALLPTSAEATQVNELQKKFITEDTRPAMVVFERPGGLDARDEAAIRHRQEALTGPGEVSPVMEARDGEAAQIIVSLPNTSMADIGTAVDGIRNTVRQDLPAGLTVYVTGPAGMIAAFDSAVTGTDFTLLLAAATVVLLILLVVYRSPILPVVVLLSGGVALTTSSMVIYYLTKAGVLTLNAQSQGILLVLVFGAATDYALLLVARYREELYRHQDRYEAMKIAWRASVPPLVASASTVILGVLCLLFSDLASNQSLGPVAAVGIAMSLLVSLTFLPAAITLIGRASFWPFRPLSGEAGKDKHRVWAAVARTVGRKPRTVWLVSLLVLLAAAAFVPQFRASGLSQNDAFVRETEAVTGQHVYGRHFPAGAGSPAVVLTDADRADEVLAVVRDVDGVDDATFTTDQQDANRPKVVDGLVEINATVTTEADSEEAMALVERLRNAVHAVPGADAKVGGYSAIQHDIRATASEDLLVIIPIVLVVVLLVLMLLLRAVVGAVLLVASVAVSFLATLGIGALMFNHVFGFADSDPSMPLFAFVFLVALGVDYNIFLVTRVREEALHRGTREGILRGLTVTGGVITSAGVVLAATFGALGVLPLVFLAQLAFLVAFGVLLDTLLVRSLLVPALMLDVGRKVWWPSALARGDT